MVLVYYRCPTCGNRVGQLDRKYIPWCAHNPNGPHRLKKFISMVEEDDNGNIQRSELDDEGTDIG